MLNIEPWSDLSSQCRTNRPRPGVRRREKSDAQDSAVSLLSKRREYLAQPAWLTQLPLRILTQTALTGMADS
jgi:hypothetical protein